MYWDHSFDIFSPPPCCIISLSHLCVLCATSRMSFAQNGYISIHVLAHLDHKKKDSSIRTPKEFSYT